MKNIKKLYLQKVGLGYGGSEGKTPPSGEISLWFSGDEKTLLQARDAITKNVKGVQCSLEKEQGKTLLKVTHQYVVHRKKPREMGLASMVGTAADMMFECGKCVAVDLGMVAVPFPVETEQGWRPGALIQLKEKAVSPYPPDEGFQLAVASAMMDRLDENAELLQQKKLSNLEGEGVQTEINFAFKDDKGATTSSKKSYVAARFMQDIPCDSYEDALRRSKQTSEIMTAIVEPAQGRGRG